MEKVTNLLAARKSSGMSQQEFADEMGISLPTYRKTEGNNDLLTIGGIKAVLPKMNKISIGIMRDYVTEIFLPYE